MLLDRPRGTVREGDPCFRETLGVGEVLGVGRADVPVGDGERDGVEVLEVGGADVRVGDDERDGVEVPEPVGPGRAGWVEPAPGPAAAWPASAADDSGTGAVDGPGRSDGPAAVVSAAAVAGWDRPSGWACGRDGSETGEPSSGSGTPATKLSTTAAVPATNRAITTRIPKVVRAARRPESSTKTTFAASCLPTASTPSKIRRQPSSPPSGAGAFRVQSDLRGRSVTRHLTTPPPWPAVCVTPGHVGRRHFDIPSETHSPLGRLVMVATTSSSLLATRRGKLLLALFCSIGFLDFIDASIVNVALPDIRRDLHFSVQNLQWVLSGYLLTYGGLMLLGGRLADLLGRRRVLVGGTAVFAASSFAGGLAQNAGTLVSARLVQGAGAAMMLPAALSLLTTYFKEGKDRNAALGAWGGVAGLASAAGVFLGGVLTQGPGWRWVLFVNPPIAAVLLIAIYAVIPAEPRPTRLANFDLLGSLLVTGGMLLLVYGLVRAPVQGWGSGRTVGELAGAGALLALFVVKEKTGRNPLMSLSTFRIRGLSAANLTLLIAAAGLIAMFFFITLYVQVVLGYSPIKAGASYLPFTAGVAVAAGICSQLLVKIGTRPLIVVGALFGAGGLYWLSHVPVHGSYLQDLLPAEMIISVGLGALFVSVTTAANAGVPADRAGLAAALMNSAQQVGGALGLAIFSAIATARTNHLLGSHDSPAHALTSGIHRALFAESIFLLATAALAVRTVNSRGESETLTVTAAPTLEPVGSA